MERAEAGGAAEHPTTLGTAQHHAARASAGLRDPVVAGPTHVPGAQGLRQ